MIALSLHNLRSINSYSVFLLFLGIKLRTRPFSPFYPLPQSMTFKGHSRLSVENVTVLFGCELPSTLLKRRFQKFTAAL